MRLAREIGVDSACRQLGCSRPSLYRWLAGAKHKPIERFRPQTNGKAEAFIKTSLREWAYVRLYSSNEERTEALPAWLDYYANHRFHTELKSTPMQALVNNLRGK